MIGTCECCDRTDVPILHIDTVFGIEAFACYLCLGESDPDPYDELQPENDCDSPFDFQNDSDRKEILAALRAVNSHADLVAALEAAEEYISVDTDIPAADAVLAQIRIALAKANGGSQS